MLVKYIDHMGSDLSVINAAKVSHDRKSDWVFKMPKNPVYNQYPIKTLSKGDISLIRYLARGCTQGEWDQLLDDVLDLEYKEDAEAVINYVRAMSTHFTPFCHTAVTLHVKAPIFVARQLGKHQVGLSWNEVSRRYVTADPEFYVPSFRNKAENVKQGSGGPLSDRKEMEAMDHLVKAHKTSLKTYNDLLDMNVCPEQARMVLPQSMYTEWYWTGSILAFYRVWNLRTDPHAQQETAEIARMIDGVIEPLFPVSWRALKGVK